VGEANAGILWNGRGCWSFVLGDGAQEEETGTANANKNLKDIKRMPFWDHKTKPKRSQQNRGLKMKRLIQGGVKPPRDRDSAISLLQLRSLRLGKGGTANPRY